MEIFCKTLDIENITKELNKKKIPTSECISLLAKNSINIAKIHEIFALFVYYGYIFTDEDILELARYSIDMSEYINVNERINKKMGEELQKICDEHGNYMYDTKITLKGFKKHFATMRFIEMKKILNENKNIIPDIECLQIACGIVTGAHQIKFLMDTYKLKPDLKCIQNAINRDNPGRVYLLFSKYTEGMDL